MAACTQRAGTITPVNARVISGAWIGLGERVGPTLRVGVALGVGCKVAIGRVGDGDTAVVASGWKGVKVGALVRDGIRAVASTGVLVHPADRKATTARHR